MPEPISPKNRIVKMEMKLGKAGIFMQFDEDAQTLVIQDGTKTRDLNGFYLIYITLIDSKGVKSNSDYLFPLHILKEEPIDENKPSSHNQTAITTLDKELSKATKKAAELRYKYSQSFEKPKVSIKKITHTGEIQCAFSHEMYVPNFGMYGESRKLQN